MGARIARIYDIVTEKKGYEGRMQFAKKTGVSRNKALKIKDSEENIRKFKLAAAEFIGESIDHLL